MKKKNVLRINNLKLKPGHSEEQLKEAVQKALGIRKEYTIEYEVVKKSIDARHKPDIIYVYSVDVIKITKNGAVQELSRYAKKKNNNIVYMQKNIYEFPVKAVSLSKDIAQQKRPVIIGFGPAGMFAALKLSEAGLKPVIYERGDSVDIRQQKVTSFWRGEELDEESNVQFGEGGAGTFSDGKLNTVIKDPTGRIRNVLETFVRFGAASDILSSNKPHIGTDVLAVVVKNIRKYCESLGAQIYFRHRLENIDITEGRVRSITVYDSISDKAIIRECESVCLAIGHSARDTFEMLNSKKIFMEPKAFAVGLRIMHPQKFINNNAYGNCTYDMPAADYKVTYKSVSTGVERGVYSFCMCPGGYVVNASSEKGRLAVNGMSYSKRDSDNANSAMIVTVTPDDYGHGTLDGVSFQRRLEKNAYMEGAGRIPVQLIGDFKKNVASTSLGCVKPCIKGEYKLANVRQILPEYISEALEEGVRGCDRFIKGFDMDEALFAGVESRTSSPVRITRNDELVAVGCEGLYPCGEGAGYAGGITSAAVDGIKVAEKIAIQDILYT